MKSLFLQARQKTCPRPLPTPLPGVRNEPTTRVCNALFAALSGFGLSHLFQKPVIGTDVMGNNREICFLIALLLILRFLFGSANHLWFEYMIQPPSRARRLLLILDALGLIAFGFFVLKICYAHCVLDFLRWTIWFGIIALIADVLMGLLRRIFGVASPSGWLWLWIAINIIQIASSAVAYYLFKSNPGAVGHGIEWSRVLFVTGLMFLALFCIDLYFQIEIIEDRLFENDPNSRPSSELIRRAVRQGQIIPGMCPFQALAAAGLPESYAIISPPKKGHVLSVPTAINEQCTQPGDIIFRLNFRNSTQFDRSGAVEFFAHFENGRVVKVDAMP